MFRGVDAYTRRATTALAGLATAAALIVAHPGVARADFSESFCAGQPSAPWTEGVIATAWAESNDTCAAADGSLGFDNHVDPLPAGNWGIGLAAPPGEEFTSESINFGAEPNSDGGVFIVFGYGSSTIVSEYEDGPSGITGQSFTAPVPDTTELWVRTDCDISGGCSLANFINVIAIGPMTVGIHDTGVPAVQPAGGSLAADGTVKGTQTLLYHASDVGSGVQKVTLSLGPDVVATDDSTCQPANLAPCPDDVSGTLTADTSLLPDGTYPVILTAYDVSGDQTPVQVATVTLANHEGTLSVPFSTIKSTKKGKGKGHHRTPVKVTARFRWDWRGATTRLDSARFGKLPTHGKITVACVGTGCPFDHLTGDRAHLERLRRHLTKRVFRPGQQLQVTIGAPHRVAEKATFVIQAGALPISQKGIKKSATHARR